MKLIDAIDELIETYNSIDIRIFCFRQDNVWKNVFTIIRFRRESVDELKELHSKTIKKCRGLIQTDKFRVGVFQFSIEKWDSIKDNLSRSSLSLSDDFAVNYFDTIGFEHSIYRPSLQSDQEHVYKIWKSYSGYSETRKSSKPSYDEDLLDKVIANYFIGFDDYLAAIFQLDKYDFQRQPWVYTYVPIFFNVESKIFDHNDVKVKISGYSQKNLQLAFNFYKSNHRGKSEFIEKKIKDIILEEKDDLIHKEITIELDTKSLGNEFELLITKNKKIILEEQGGSISDYWKERSAFTNPLYFAFEKFVDYESLEKMLFEFKANDIKDDAKVFERGVSWLLSLLGIPNVMLGKHEKIGQGSDIISADIIGAMNQKQLILVNATKGLPKQSDFDRERDYRENLAKMIPNPEIEILSIYFTGKEPTESQNSANTNQITLIGHSKLKLILEHLKKGKLEEARNIIFNSDF